MLRKYWHETVLLITTKYRPLQIWDFKSSDYNWNFFKTIISYIIFQIYDSVYQKITFKFCFEKCNLQFFEPKIQYFELDSGFNEKHNLHNIN